MATILPTLSSSGWAVGDIERIDRALAYALLTDGLQSNIYRDSLTSIPVIIQESLNDEVSLKLKSRDILEQYFKRLFDDAMLEVYVRKVEDKPGHLNLVIRASITIGEKQYDIQRVATSIDGKFVQIQNIVNA